MKQKIIQFISGLIIYFIFGVIMVFVAGDKLPNKWQFVAIWTICMSLAHFFLIEPFRIRMAKKKAKQ